MYTYAFPGAEPGPAGTEQHPFSVSAYLNQADYHLKSQGYFYIIGEISELFNRRHLYFSLKDERSSVSCLIFYNDVIRLGFVPTAGMQVIVHGRGSVYYKDGRFKLIVSSMLPAGQGLLLARLQQLKEKLAREGVFSAHKRELPEPVLQAGVITSPEGQALQDILYTLQRRNPGIAVRIYPALVQGTEAPRSLRRALRLANEERMCQVLIIGRGGGSLEDLLAFSDESLVREVAASEIPVISAVGHTENFALTDLAADKEAITPTAAAEMISPVTREDRLSLVGECLYRLHNAAGYYLNSADTRLSRLQERLEFKGPATRLDLLDKNLQTLESELRCLSSEQLSEAEKRLLSLQGRLREQDPLHQIDTLARTLDQCIQRLDSRIEQSYRSLAEDGSRVLERFDKYAPEAALDSCARRLEQLESRLKTAADTILYNRDSRLMQIWKRLDSGLIDSKLSVLSESCSRLNARLEALNPLRVLERDYSITRDSSGRSVDFEKLSPGDEITTLLKGGAEIVSKVTGKRRRPELTEP